MTADLPKPTQRSPLARLLWVTLGLLFTALGGLGAVLPVLPTTPFLLLAAACFARSSDRLLHWLLNLKGVGPAIQDFRAGRGVPARAKWLAVGTMWLFAGLSFGPGMPAEWFWPRVALLVLAAIGTITVLSLKTRVPSQ